MDDAKPSKPKASTPFAFADAAKAKAKARARAKAVDATRAGKAEDGHGATPPPGRGRWLRWACCVLAATVALAAVAMLALSLTVLKVRDPTLSMDSVEVRWYSVRFGGAGAGAAARPLRINVTLAGSIVIRNPNYESMRFGASDTEIFVDGVDGPVGVGRAPPGEVPARGAIRVTADVDVFVDRVGSAVVGEVLFGSGEVRLASRTAVDGRISVLGGLYGRREVRVAMRCRVALRVSAAVVVAAGNPACVADFGR